MKIKLTVLLLAAVIAASVFPLAGCTFIPSVGEYTITRVTVDINLNPGIEFLVDSDNKVISAAALDSDGEILLAGEDFLGLAPDKATAKLLEIAAATGYLTSGKNGVNNVEISVSGSSDYAEVITDMIVTKANRHLNKLGVNGKAEKISPADYIDLRELILDTGYYTKEDLDNYVNDELYSALYRYRIETASLISEELREVYCYAKNRHIEVATREENAKILESMGSEYALVYGSYKTLLTAYSDAAKALEDLRYNAFVSPDSDYQKAMIAMRKAKNELVIIKNKFSDIDSDSAEYKTAAAELELKTAAYETAKAAFKAADETAKSTLWELMDALNESRKLLDELEAEFDKSIKSKFRSEAIAIQTRLAEKKAAFFAEYEEAHKNDINAIINDIKAKKQALIESNGK